MRSLLFFLLSSVVVFAQDGAAIYKTRCAGCHDTPTGRVPPVSALRTMKPATIMQSLESGPMKPQAAGLSNGERYALVTYLASPEAKPEAPSTAGLCGTRTSDLDQMPRTGATGAAIWRTRVFKPRKQQD